MSARKHRAKRRMCALLRAAQRGGLVFHCEGGRSMHGPDIKRLLDAGLIRFTRSSPGYGRQLPSKRFPAQFKWAFLNYPYEPGGYLHGRVNRTYAVITAPGELYLKNYCSEET